MVVVARPLRFDENDPRPMLRHLDTWARRRLGSPEGWASTLERCDQWVDYSARNQMLLASYGVVGPVAGTATWERVPSGEDDRGCAVRAGEHGLPVRVPVVDDSEVTSDRSRLGARSATVAGSHRWEPVFALEQLARRPAPGTLAAPAVPELTGAGWAEAVRVASGRMLGRTPRRVNDPTVQLASLAGRVHPGPGRVRLDATLAEQAAWLVAARVGRAEGPMPAFDPGGLSVRERWRTAVDVRHAAGRVLGAVSFAVGVELARSPLPRHDAADDRAVPAGRRNYLSAAEVRGLPLGVWVEAGPYTRAEWLARGVAGGVGVAAFLRVNDRSYLAAYETRGGAMWRLETTGRGAHMGLVGEGTAENLDDARRGARDALTERFPDAARAVRPSVGAPVLAPDHGWVPLPDGRDDRTQHRVVDERVTAMVCPGPGGRWEAWVSVDGHPRQGPLAPDDVTARGVADGLARGALMELAAQAPDRANTMLADLAASPDSWNRDTLVTVLGGRLGDADRAELATTTDPARLVGLMGDAGVAAPATMLAVLRAENTDLDAALGVLPTMGMAVGDAISQLHRLWDADRLTVGTALGATVEELRAGGCTPVELLAAAPREILRRLDSREHTWTLTGPALLDAGYSPAAAVAHLAAHAPTPATFAAAVAAITDDPVAGMALAGRCAAVEDLAALSERYELSPDDTASVLAAAGVATATAVAVVSVRCDGDLDATCALAADRLGLAPTDTAALLEPDPITPITPAVPLRASTEAERLLDAIGPPEVGATPGLDAASLLAALPDPDNGALAPTGVELEDSR